MLWCKDQNHHFWQEYIKNIIELGPFGSLKMDSILHRIPCLMLFTKPYFPLSTNHVLDASRC